MSSEAQPVPSTGGEIQFDRADFVQPSEGPACAVCGRSLQGHYFEVNGEMACEGCRYAVETAFQQRGGLGGFVKAACAGFGAAVAGSILYYAVREISGLEIGLISILVSVVRKGSLDLTLAVVRGLVLLSLLFGTNHAVELFRGGHFHPALYSPLGAMSENLVAVALGAALLWASRHREARDRR